MLEDKRFATQNDLTIAWIGLDWVGLEWFGLECLALDWLIDSIVDCV